MAMDFDDILSDDNLNGNNNDDNAFTPEEIGNLGGNNTGDNSIIDDSVVDISTPNRPREASGNIINDTSNDNVPTRNLNMLLDVEVPVSIRMGTSKLFLKDVLGLSPGNIIELDEYADDLIQLTIGDKAIARGEVVIVDGYFAFRIKAIMSKTDRIQQLRG